MPKPTWQLYNEMARTLQERFEIYSIEQLKANAKSAGLASIYFAIEELLQSLPPEDYEALIAQTPDGHIIDIVDGELVIEKAPTSDEGINSRIAQQVFYTLSRLPKIEG